MPFTRFCRMLRTCVARRYYFDILPQSLVTIILMIKVAIKASRQERLPCGFTTEFNIILLFLSRLRVCFD